MQQQHLILHVKIRLSLKQHSKLSNILYYFINTSIMEGKYCIGLLCFMFEGLESSRGIFNVIVTPLTDNSRFCMNASGACQWEPHRGSFDREIQPTMC